jgi:hypothetical protein
VRSGLKGEKMDQEVGDVVDICHGLAIPPIPHHDKAAGSQLLGKGIYVPAVPLAKDYRRSYNGQGVVGVLLGPSRIDRFCLEFGSAILIEGLAGGAFAGRALRHTVDRNAAGESNMLNTSRARGCTHSARTFNIDGLVSLERPHVVSVFCGEVVYDVEALEECARGV